MRLPREHLPDSLPKHERVRRFCGHFPASHQLGQLIPDRSMLATLAESPENSLGKLANVRGQVRRQGHHFTHNPSGCRAGSSRLVEAEGVSF